MVQLRTTIAFNLSTVNIKPITNIMNRGFVVRIHELNFLRLVFDQILNPKVHNIDKHYNIALKF